MKSLGWLTGCALALACAHESKAVVGVSDTKTQGTVAGEVSQPQAASTASDATAFHPLEEGNATTTTVERAFLGLTALAEAEPTRFITSGQCLSRTCPSIPTL